MPPIMLGGSGQIWGNFKVILEVKMAKNGKQQKAVDSFLTILP